MHARQTYITCVSKRMCTTISSKKESAANFIDIDHPLSSQSYIPPPSPTGYGDFLHGKIFEFNASVDINSNYDFSNRRFYCTTWVGSIDGAMAALQTVLAWTITTAVQEALQALAPVTSVSSPLSGRPTSVPSATITPPTLAPHLTSGTW